MSVSVHRVTCPGINSDAGYRPILAFDDGSEWTGAHNRWIDQVYGLNLPANLAIRILPNGSQPAVILECGSNRHETSATKIIEPNGATPFHLPVVNGTFPTPTHFESPVDIESPVHAYQESFCKYLAERLNELKEAHSGNLLSQDHPPKFVTGELKAKQSDSHTGTVS